MLASKLLGIPVSDVKNMLSTETMSVICAYLFTLGTVGELRSSMNIDNKIPDDWVVCKYGKTNNLMRRTGEHTKTYGSIKGATLRLGKTVLSLERQEISIQTNSKVLLFVIFSTDTMRCVF